MSSNTPNWIAYHNILTALKPLTFQWDDEAPGISQVDAVLENNDKIVSLANDIWTKAKLNKRISEKQIKCVALLIAQADPQPLKSKPTDEDIIKKYFE